MTDKKSIIKVILAVSLVFVFAYYIYFVATIFERKDLRRGKATVHEIIPKKVVNQQGILGKEHNVTQRLQERRRSVQQKVTNVSDVNMQELRARHERLERLVQSSMTDPNTIIISPSEANDWRGVTRGELTARHERLDDDIYVSMTDPDETIISPSEANDWRGVTRGELTARHERLDDDIYVSMTDPDETIISPSEANDWQGVTRGELTARHERLDIEIENSMKNPKNIVFPQTGNVK